jgi:hypothetical protein
MSWGPLPLGLAGPRGRALAGGRRLLALDAEALADEVDEPRPADALVLL